MLTSVSSGTAPVLAVYCVLLQLSIYSGNPVALSSKCAFFRRDSSMKLAVLSGRSTFLALFIGLAVLTCSSMAQRTPHRFKLLTSQRIRSIMRCNDVENIQQYDFPRILQERVPGTPGHEEVKEYILSRLNQLNCSRWNITEHHFEDSTPLGMKPFTNIIATLDPHIDRRLVLAAHYDSKYFANKKFLGATDSALSVALLLDLALTLDQKLANRQLQEVSLQLIFTDGEEAFRSWTSTDSIYGARRLASDMETTGLLSVGEKNALEAMEAFVLLDLIGSTQPWPNFYDMYHETTDLFQRMVKTEKRLKEMGHLESHLQPHFKEAATRNYHIGDDHEPFLERGVPIVHLITYPFPQVWHKLSDNAQAIDWTFVSNFRKILTVFIHEYFHLQ